MKKLALVFIVLIGGAGGAYYYFNLREPVEKPTVTTTAISQGDIREIVQATGTVSALRTMAVGSQVSGIVKEIHVDFNSIVRKGQLMAEIDPSLLQVQVDIQEANYERQLGEIANLEVQLADAKRQLERTRALAVKHLVNQQQLDTAELTVKSRTTSLDAARKQLLTTQASLNSAKLNVEYTKIYAPMDGVVINRQVDRGVTVQASMRSPTFFFLATDLRTLKIAAGVDEAEVGKIRTGMPVEFTVASYPGVTFHGDVEAVRLNANTANNVVTYPVWINAPNPDLRLKPAMTATLRIVVGTEENIVRIPNQALRFRPTSEMYTALGLTPPTAGQGGRVVDAPMPVAPGAAGTAGAGRARGAGRGRGSDNLTDAPVARDAEKIDELFPSIPRRLQTGNVWTWDEAKKELNQIRVTTGITDGQFSQLVTGDVNVGQQIVSNITLPVTAQQQNNLFGQQPGQRRGGPGFGPAAPPPPNPVGGGFGGGGRGGGGGGGGGGRGGGF